MFKFETAAIPTVERVKAANPFVGKVQELASSVDKDGRSTSAAQFVVDTVDVNRRVRHLQEAGKSVGVSVRKSLVESEDGETTTVTFWTTPKVTRPRLDKD